jgi:hypothetical protein
MIILDATTKSLEIVLASAITTNQLPFVLGYVDVLSSDMSVSAVGSNDGASNSTTPVTVLAAPVSGHTRQVKFLSVQNADTVPAVVTLQYNDNSTERTIVTITLAVGDNLIIDD